MLLNAIAWARNTTVTVNSECSRSIEQLYVREWMVIIPVTECAMILLLLRSRPCYVFSPVSKAKSAACRSVSTDPLSFLWACLFVVGCLTSQQHASVFQGRICTDNFTCCHTEIEAADPTFHLTQSQNTDTGPTSPSL